MRKKFKGRVKVRFKCYDRILVRAVEDFNEKMDTLEESLNVL